MGGTTLTIHADDEQLRRAARGFRAALERLDTSELMHAVGGEVLAATMERFRKGVSPEGDRWPVTIRQKTGDSRPPLLGTAGKLSQSYTYRIGPRHVEVGSNLKYSAIHHFGGVIRAKRAKALRFRIGGAWVMRKAVRIPARPALGLNDEDEANLIHTAEDWLRMALKEFASGGRA